jgi:hypothetical protein
MKDKDAKSGHPFPAFGRQQMPTRQQMPHLVDASLD